MPWPYHRKQNEQTLPKVKKTATCNFPDCNRVALYMNSHFKMCEKHKEFLMNDYVIKNGIDHIIRSIKE